MDTNPNVLGIGFRAGVRIIAALKDAVDTVIVCVRNGIELVIVAARAADRAKIPSEPRNVV